MSRGSYLPLPVRKQVVRCKTLLAFNVSIARQKRDVEDTVVIFKTIAGEERNPFAHNSVLKNIMTGESVDVDEARAK